MPHECSIYENGDLSDISLYLFLCHYKLANSTSFEEVLQFQCPTMRFSTQGLTCNIVDSG